MTRGFSLIEVVISLAIIATAFVAASALLSTATLGRETGDKTLGLAIASNEMETLRAGGYASLPSSGSFSDARLADLPSGAGALAISDWNTKTKEVVVTVSWEEPAVAATSTVSLTTLVTQTGGLP